MVDVFRVYDNLCDMVSAMESFQLELICVRVDVVYKLIDQHIIEGHRLMIEIRLLDYLNRHGMQNLLREVLMFGMECYDMYVEMELDGTTRDLPAGGVGVELLKLENATNNTALMLASISPYNTMLEKVRIMNNASNKANDKVKMLAFMMGSHNRLGPLAMRSFNPDVIKTVKKYI